jgi:hypothetical protein
LAFTPDGEHTIRVSWDRDGKLWHVVCIHQYNRRRTLCPDYCHKLDPTGNFPPCAICIMAAQRQDKQLRREALGLLYGALYRTSHPTPHWVSGNSYLMIAPAELCVGLAQFLAQGSAQERANFFTMANAQLPGPALVVRVKKRPQVSVTITSFTAESLPPIIIGARYVPLKQSWMAEFNLRDYEGLLAQVTSA